MPRLTGIDHLVLTVLDIGRTLDFYTRVLGMRAETFTPADGSTRHALFFGSQKINLHASGAEFDPKASRPQPGSADLCFVTGTPLTDWQETLGARIIEGPVRRTGARGPMTSVYLRDPDGNLIEIAHYE